MKKINLVASTIAIVVTIDALLISDNPDIFYSGFFAGCAGTIAVIMWLDDDD